MPFDFVWWLDQVDLAHLDHLSHQEELFWGHSPPWKGGLRHDAWLLTRTMSLWDDARGL